MWQLSLLLMQTASSSGSDPSYYGFATPIIGLGGFGLLLILLLIRRLVLISELDETKADRDTWKDSAFKLMDALSVAQASLKELSDQNEITDKLLSEIKDQGQRRIR